MTLWEFFKVNFPYLVGLAMALFAGIMFYLRKRDSQKIDSLNSALAISQGQNKIADLEHQKQDGYTQIESLKKDEAAIQDNINKLKTGDKPADQSGDDLAATLTKELGDESK